MTIDLTNKTALITGASRGIGEAAAISLAQYGANVVLCARSSSQIEKISKEIGPKAFAVQCDVTSYEDVDSAVGAAVKRFGSLDIVVNNAGTIEPIARLENSDPLQWGLVVDVNLKGVYHVLRASYNALKKGGGGVVVNMSSGAATGALEGWSHYCATKAAVLSLTKCAHKEWADEGVRVVGLSPGTVATAMQTAIKESQINPVSEMDWSQHIPALWVGETIAWLCTPEAQKYDGTDFSLKSEEARGEVGLI